MPATLDAPALLTRDQAAEYLGIAPQTLAVWATNGRYGLPLLGLVDASAIPKPTSTGSLPHSWRGCRIGPTKEPRPGSRQWPGFKEISVMDSIAVFPDQQAGAIQSAILPPPTRRAVVGDLIISTITPDGNGGFAVTFRIGDGEPQPVRHRTRPGDVHRIPSPGLQSMRALVAPRC